MSESTAADRLEILGLLSRHQIYIDLKDADGYAGLYAEDGSYASPFGESSGRAAIQQMFLDLQASGFTTGKRHMSGPAMVDVDGDRLPPCRTTGSLRPSRLLACTPPAPTATSWRGWTAAG